MVAETEVRKPEEARRDRKIADGWEPWKQGRSERDGEIEADLAMTNKLREFATFPARAELCVEP